MNYKKQNIYFDSFTIFCKCCMVGSIPRSSELVFTVLSTTPQGRGFLILKIRAILRYQDFEDRKFVIIGER
jgi:hypothetical protein